jgi:protein tyrosine/serine phosphatase
MPIRGTIPRDIVLRNTGRKNEVTGSVVHCWHGSDRTGLISAMYRILYQNWSKEEAIEELMKGGYGYHSLYRNIPEYIRKVNIEGIRQRVLAP